MDRGEESGSVVPPALQDEVRPFLGADAIKTAAEASLAGITGSVHDGAQTCVGSVEVSLMNSSPSLRRPRPGSALRTSAVVGALALVAAACGSAGQSSAAGAHSKSPMPEMSSSMPMASPSMSMGAGMALPMGAKHMKVTIASPMTGMKVTGNSVMVHVQVTGYKDTCALAGRPLMMGMEATATGHYHVLLDGSLINSSAHRRRWSRCRTSSPGCTRSRWCPRWMTTRR